jgi:hypothetical protein
MLSTFRDGALRTLNDKCSIAIPGYETIQLKILPEITDSKSAKYADEPVIGRSTPLKSYSYSDNRVLSIKLSFQAISRLDLLENVRQFYAISSLTYPRHATANGPYAPPPICRFRCGSLFGREPLCVILDNYSLSIPTDVVWDDETLVPYYFSISTSWHVVYSSARLPHQEDILAFGGTL